MITSISDFTFVFAGAGHYRVIYTSPLTAKRWVKLVSDMTWIDEFKGTTTQDHSQNRLKQFKRFIKNL